MTMVSTLGLLTVQPAADTILPCLHLRRRYYAAQKRCESVFSYCLLGRYCGIGFVLSTPYFSFGFRACTIRTFRAVFVRMIDDTADATTVDILLQRRMHMGFLGTFTAPCEVESRKVSYMIFSYMR